MALHADAANRARTRPAGAALGRDLALAAGYAAGVFGAAFLFGAFRVLVVAPRIGSRAAELIELPLMLGVTVLAARAVGRRLAPGISRRLAMGAIALALLLAAEILTGVALRGVSWREALATPDPVTGPLYYASLAVFALLPAVIGATRPRPDPP